MHNFIRKRMTNLFGSWTSWQINNLIVKKITNLTMYKLLKIIVLWRKYHLILNTQLVFFRQKQFHQINFQ